MFFFIIFFQDSMILMAGLVERKDTLPETNSKSACQVASSQKERIVFQPPFSGAMLVSGRVDSRRTLR